MVHTSSKQIHFKHGGKTLMKSAGNRGLFKVGCYKRIKKCKKFVFD